jgi:KUP system potassium uptake protein
MGSVVLAVTGAEALYADMGHFGAGRSSSAGSTSSCRPAARIIWGRAHAAFAAARRGAGNGQESLLLPCARAARAAAGILRHLATIIASQAVISGAFSVTQQAIQLGFIPRLRSPHQRAAAGQIYIPVVNWALMIMVILLVLTFGRRRTSPRPMASR